MLDRPTPSLCNDPALLDDWHAVAFSADLVPGQVYATRLLGRDLVGWRDASGAPHIWDDLCIHRGARLSKGWIADDTLVCPYHGWRYNGEARCVLIPVAPGQPIPPKARAFPVAIREQDGLVWATLGQPAHEPPPFPERGLPGFRTFFAGPYPWQANGFRAIENFLDPTHFPFVHAGVNGVPANPDVIPDYQVVRDETGVHSSEIDVLQPYGDFRGVPVMAGYSYSAFRPLAAYFSKRVRMINGAGEGAEAPGERFTSFFVSQPVDEVSCINRVVFAINFAPHLTLADMLPRQDLVYGQDRDIVETQRPERIPVDLRAELHHRSDRMGVAYRRFLAELGITYGVA